MLCQFEKLLYPKDAHAASAGSYMVAVYRPCEIVRDSSGSILPQFKAVGYFLPVSNHLRYDMKGHWSRNAKHGTQFEVDSYDEVIIPSREGYRPEDRGEDLRRLRQSGFGGSGQGAG